MFLDVFSQDEKDDFAVRQLFAQGVAFVEDELFSDRALTEPAWRAKLMESLKHYKRCGYCQEPIIFLVFNGRRVPVDADTTELGDEEVDLKRHSRHDCRGRKNDK